MTSTDAPPELVEWMRETFAAKEIRTERRPGGASRAGWATDVVRPDGTTSQMWLRANAPENTTRPRGGVYDSLRREAAVYVATRRAGLPVPAVLAIHPTHDAFVTERVEGEHRFSLISDPAMKELVARDYMRRLATLHRLNPLELNIDALGPVRDMRHLMSAEIDEWERRFQRSGHDDPLIALAVRWLRENLSAVTRTRVSLVHGDPGPGNFLFLGTEVTAMLDWELAHWGDPHDDLGWLLVHHLQEPLPELGSLFQAYEEAFGQAIDWNRLRYYRVLAETRCAGGILSSLHDVPLSHEYPNLLIYGALHYQQLVELLHEELAIPRMPPSPDSPDLTTEFTAIFDQVIDDMKATVVPAIHETFARRRAISLVRSVKYLREIDRLGARFAIEEAHDLAGALNHNVINLTAARRRLAEGVRSGEYSKEACLLYCTNEARRRTRIVSGSYRSVRKPVIYSDGRHNAFIHAAAPIAGAAWSAGWDASECPTPSGPRRGPSARVRGNGCACAPTHAAHPEPVRGTGTARNSGSVAMSLPTERAPAEDRIEHDRVLVLYTSAREAFGGGV